MVGLRNLNIISKPRMAEILPSLLDFGSDDDYRDDPVVLKYNNYKGRDRVLNLDTVNSRHLEVANPEKNGAELSEEIEDFIDIAIGEVYIRGSLERVDENDISMYDSTLSVNGFDDIHHSTQQIKADFWTEKQKEDYTVIETQVGPVVVGTNAYREFALIEKEGDIIDLVEEERVSRDTMEGVNPEGVYQAASTIISDFHQLMGIQEAFETETVLEEPVEMYKEMMREGVYEPETADAEFDLDTYSPQGCHVFKSDASKAEQLFMKMEDIARFYVEFEEDYVPNGEPAYDIPIKPMRAKGGSEYKFRILENDVSMVTQREDSNEDYEEIIVKAFDSHEGRTDQF